MTGTLPATLTTNAHSNLKTHSDTDTLCDCAALNWLTQVTQTGQPTQSYVNDGAGRDGY